MAVITSTNPTIFDVLSTMQADRTINATAIAMLLAETNEILDDAVVVEANNGDNNKEVINIMLPTVGRRYYNEAILPNTGKFAAVTDHSAMFYQPFVMDKAMLELAKNREEYLLAQARVHIEAMNQSMARALIYGGGSSDHETILGFFERYSTMTKKNEDGVLPETAEYVLDAGGTGTNLTSILAVVWSYGNGAYMFYPQGSVAGLKQAPLVEDDTMPKDGGFMPAVRTSFDWRAGLCVKNPKQCVRIANIDLDTIEADKLIKLMIEASEMLDSPQAGRACFYMNRKTRTTLRQLIVTGGKLSQMFWYDNAKPRLEGIEGRKIMMFDDMPIRRVDAISLNEAQVI